VIILENASIIDACCTADGQKTYNILRDWRGVVKCHIAHRVGRRDDNSAAYKLHMLRALYMRRLATAITQNCRLIVDGVK